MFPDYLSVSCDYENIKTSDRGQWRGSTVSIVNFELIPQLVLVFLLWSLSKYLFALCELFYISIVFRFDGLKFHPFLERISAKWNGQWVDLKQCNGKCISIKFLWWNLNYELTALIINELHTFFISNIFFQLNRSVV